jgi:hypothetical protein
MMMYIVARKVGNTMRNSVRREGRQWLEGMEVSLRL